MGPDLHLEIVTPERRVLSERVEEVVFPTVEGSMGVLPGHAPLLAQLDAGEVSYRLGTVRRYLAISGGYVEVLRDAVNMLARTAEPAEEIDVERAARARKEAQERLAEAESESAFRKASVRLRRAVARIEVHARVRS